MAAAAAAAAGGGAAQAQAAAPKTEEPGSGDGTKYYVDVDPDATRGAYGADGDAAMQMMIQRPPIAPGACVCVAMWLSAWNYVATRRLLIQISHQNTNRLGGGVGRVDTRQEERRLLSHVPERLHRHGRRQVRRSWIMEGLSLCAPRIAHHLHIHTQPGRQVRGLQRRLLHHQRLQQRRGDEAERLRPDPGGGLPGAHEVRSGVRRGA